MSDRQSITKKRISFLSFVVVALGIVIILRLLQLQVIEHKKYSERADALHFSSRSTIFDRGFIFLNTKDGESIKIASVKDGYKIIINPENVTQKDLVYDLLVPFLDPEDKSKESFFANYINTDKKYIEYRDELSYDEVASLLNQKLPFGIRVEKMRWRYYPANNTAAQTIGFVAYNEDKLDGRYGIERYYDGVLARGEDRASTNFFTELFRSKKEKILNKQGDVYLSIEPKVQSFLDGIISDTQDKWNSQATGGIIINPKNGEIYAISISPNFNLNEFENVEYTSLYSNPFAERVYELGSVIKPLFVATGLDLGVITPESRYYDNGSIWVEDKEIFNFDKKGRGDVSMQDVLGQSLNTGMVDLSLKIGKDNIRKYMYEFGLGEQTGIDIPNETKGLLKNLESPRNLEYATASFGQGIAITPLEAVRAFSSLINGGYLVTPHIATKISYSEGLEEELSYEPKKMSTITKETSDTIKAMLIKNVDEYYHGKPTFLDGYSIGAKTGTAQIPNLVDGGYYTDRNMHSFFGFIGNDDPEFMVFLYTIYPKGIRYAAQTLLPPFMDISEYLVSYYDLPPDR
ncbi:MAG: penicillin-binding protein 2 [Candidatus Paceibacterota bacterium]